MVFHLYRGKDDDLARGGGMGERVVLTLAEPYLDKGYHIYCDNFFSSPALAYNLLLRDTYMIGTCREKRKGVPATIKKRLDKRRTSRGASVADFAVHKDGRKLFPEVHCFFWMDKKTSEPHKYDHSS